MRTDTSYLILNGDSLHEQFPEAIDGKKIIARECLVDGNIKGATLEEFYKNRIDFLNKNYGGVTKLTYYKNTVSQFETILNVPQDANVYLWFEDDVFCQVNFWFIASLLVNKQKPLKNIFLIRPQEHLPYSFAKHTDKQLIEIYNKPINITKDITSISKLWNYYSNNKIHLLEESVLELKKQYPFIHKATEALLESIPTSTSLGRPKEALIELKQKLNTNDFGILFRAFSEREAIYGFGDLQVFRLLQEIE